VTSVVSTFFALPLSHLIAGENGMVPCSTIRGMLVVSSENVLLLCQCPQRETSRQVRLTFSVLSKRHDPV